MPSQPTAAPMPTRRRRLAVSVLRSAARIAHAKRWTVSYVLLTFEHAPRKVGHAFVCPACDAINVLRQVAMFEESHRQLDGADLALLIIANMVETGDLTPFPA